jgi:hypothetical protein
MSMRTVPRPLTDTIASANKYRDATPFPSRLLRTLERDAVPAVIVAAFAVVLTAGLPKVLNQDGWLALLSGREISRHGLPSADQLTMWSAGERWIDQQWLGHLGIYGLYALGGVRLLLICHGLLAVGTFALAVVGARRLGGSPGATALVAAAAFFPIISTISELRTQLPGSMLFLLVVWLLIGEGRAPSRRVYLVFPLLVIWANVHGSVVLGAGLTVLAGLVFAWEQLRDTAESRLPGWRIRSITLVAGAIACVFASPYGLSLVDYYHRTLLNGSFGKFVTEWRPTTLSAGNVPVFLIACVGLWLLGRAGARVSLFERLAFVAIVPGAFLALRNIGFLGLVALLVLPLVVDGVIPRRKPAGPSPVRLGLAIATAAGAGIAAVALFGAPGRAFADRYPPVARETVARALERDPKAHVFADEHFADWLLFRIPSARGRVAFDARFELLSKTQLERLYRWAAESTDHWRAAAAGNSIVVVYRPHDKRKTAAIVRSGGRVLYSDREVAVLAVPPTFGQTLSR